MALADVGVYAWVRNSLGPLGDGKIPSSPTWKLYLLQVGGYNPNFNTDEAFSAVPAAAIVAVQTIAPGAFSAGLSTVPDTTYPLLTGDQVGAVVLTVSGSVERLYAHWGKANSGLPFTPTGDDRIVRGLQLQHQTVTT